MDLNAYFTDKRATEAELRREYPKNVVYITSLFHRDRNSTAGATMSASWNNAARVITDGTHRLATEKEVKEFLAHQQEELHKNTVSEQMNKKQYFVVLPGAAGDVVASKVEDTGSQVNLPGGSVVAAFASDRGERSRGKTEEART
jgi:hypothetical protein